jgi:hypothetical protein
LKVKGRQASTPQIVRLGLAKLPEEQRKVLSLAYLAVMHTVDSEISMAIGNY